MNKSVVVLKYCVNFVQTMLILNFSQYEPIKSLDLVATNSKRSVRVIHEYFPRKSLFQVKSACYTQITTLTLKNIEMTAYIRNSVSYFFFFFTQSKKEFIDIHKDNIFKQSCQMVQQKILCYISNVTIELHLESAPSTETILTF